MESKLRIVIGDSWQPRALPYFAMLMMALMLITEVLNLKFVNFFGISIIGSQVSFVLSLVVADLLAEVYGYRRVRRLLWIGLLGLILYTVFVQIVVVLPAAAGYSNNNLFVTLFGEVPRIALGSITAYFVTERINSYIMSRLKVYFAARYFYGRALTAVAIAQAIDVVVFYGIAYGGVFSLSLIISASTVSWVACMVCEVLVLPLTKRLARYVKEYEGVEHFDSEPRVPPLPPS